MRVRDFDCTLWRLGCRRGFRRAVRDVLAAVKPVQHAALAKNAYIEVNDRRSEAGQHFGSVRAGATVAKTARVDVGVNKTCATPTTAGREGDTMSGHHNKVGRVLQRRQLQAASGALGRFSDDLRQSHKAAGWSPRAAVNAHRDGLALALAAIQPVIEQRVAEAVKYDAECKADAFPYRGPGQLPPTRPIVSGGLRPQDTGQVRQVADATAEERRLLAEFEAEVKNIYMTNPGNPEAAQRGVTRARATFATKLALRTGGSR